MFPMKSKSLPHPSFSGVKEDSLAESEAQKEKELARQMLCERSKNSYCPSNMDEPIESTLARHLALCEETYQVLFQENRILKSTGRPPDQEFLRDKEGLLQRFDDSHKALAVADRSAARHCRTSIEKTQQIVLKTLLLDRENEQLLLKCALGPKPRPVSPPASSNRIRKVYGEAKSRLQ
jgi:hypothetical protein